MLDDRPNHPVTLTRFRDQFATTKTEQSFALPDLARLIETTTARSKSGLPWLKFAKFGDIRTEPDADGKGGNSLRHNANVLAVTGVEADYDAGLVTVDQVCSRLVAAELLALVYTSPRHSEDAPRWRVLCPTLFEYPPDHRDHYMARLNGVCGGIFAPESWTLSQSYYYGSINANPSHRVVLLPGWPIDLATELDASAIGKPVKPEAATRPSYPAADPSRITDRRLNGKLRSLLANISAARKHNVHNTLLRISRAVGGYAWLLPYSDDELLGMLLNALPPDPDPDPKTERQTALDGLKHGKLSPCCLEERPYPVQFAGRGRAA